MRPAVIRAYALGIITGSMLTAGLAMLATPAKADVTNAAIDAYARPVCSTLDAYNTVEGVGGVLTFLVGDQLYSAEDAADIVVNAVISYCPRHLGLLQRFVDTYAPAAGHKVA